MKKIVIMLTVLIFTQVGFADSPFLQYEFGLEHKGNEFYVSLRLFENADMSVEVRPIEEAGAQILIPDILWTDINPFLFEQIYRSSKDLSQAQTRKIDKKIVCQLHVPYAMYVNHLSIATPYDADSQSFAETLKVIKGPEGCWITNSVYLVDDEKDQSAKALKLKLRNWFQQSALIHQAVVIR